MLGRTSQVSSWHPARLRIRHHSTISLSVSSESNHAKLLCIFAKRCCRRPTEALSRFGGKAVIVWTAPCLGFIDSDVYFGHTVILDCSSRRIDPRIRIILVADTGGNSLPPTARVPGRSEFTAVHPTTSILITLKDDIIMEAQPSTTRQRAKHKAPVRHPARRSGSSRGEHDIIFEDPDLEDGSIWHDAPLFAAILPCVGALFLWDGADYVTDTILFICVTWYLHMLIKGKYRIPVCHSGRQL